MTQPEDTIRQARGASRADWWTGIVETYVAPVYRFVGSRVKADSVDDIVQDVFVAAAQAAGRIDPSREVWPWLATIARRKIADHYRQTGRRGVLAGPVAWLASDEQTRRAIVDQSPLPEDVCQREELAALARAALSSLEPSHRECLIARYFDGLSLEQIAAQRGLSTSAANSLLYRARSELRSAFLKLAGEAGASEDCGP